jgi:hypothetical protein
MVMGVRVPDLGEGSLFVEGDGGDGGEGSRSG